MNCAQALVIEVFLPGGRFHGRRRTDSDRRAGGATDKEEWPPSPMRVFQALVAGSYGGRWIAEADTSKDAALHWLECLAPPIVAAPRACALQPVAYFVPNNDMDAVGGDPDRVAELRVQKVLRTTQFDGSRPILYAWPMDDVSPHAQTVVALADRLHTLGHGVDHAFARATVIDAQGLRARLDSHVGSVARPSARADGQANHGIACPTQGTLQSLQQRHRRTQERFREQRAGRVKVVEFRQPPRALQRTVAYDQAPARLVFELRDAQQPSRFQPALHTAAAVVVKAVRDLAFAQLAAAFPERRAEIDAVVCGRGPVPPDPHARVQIIALPSIGHAHASPSIRRVLVQVPADGPLAREDVRWALQGRVFGGDADADGVIHGSTVLLLAEDERMAGRYLVRARRWRSITPVVLPRLPGTGRRDGSQRAADEVQAAVFVTQALRHASIPARVQEVRVQREPFQARGVLAGAHGADRFGADRLTHVELRFDRPVAGPLAIGDGRWLGLGLMMPMDEPPAELYLLRIEGRGPGVSRAVEICRALRRAVMARVQQGLKPGEPLPKLVSGHEPDGSPAEDERHRHLYYVAYDSDRDGYLDRLAVAAPRGAASTSRRQLKGIARALDGLNELRAGVDGVLRLAAVQPAHDDDLWGASSAWISHTPYRPTRHPKQHVDQAIADDIRMECRRHGLPRPTAVEVLRVLEGARGGVSAQVQLRFATVVVGPVLLGKEAHFGRCLFTRTSAG